MPRSDRESRRKIPGAHEIPAPRRQWRIYTDSKDVEKVAEVRAEIDLGRDRGAVLAAFGLDSEAWSRLGVEAIAQLADDVDRGETANIERYKVSYDKRRGPDPAAVSVGAVAPAPVATPAPVHVAPVAAQAPRAVAVIDVDRTDMIDGRAIREQLLRGSTPFDPNATPALPARAAAAPPPSRAARR